MRSSSAEATIHRTAGGAVLALALSLAAAGAAAEPFRLASAVDAPAGTRIGGSARVLVETLDNQFRAGGSGGDQLVSVRTLLDMEVDLGPSLTLVGELQDSRAWLGDSGTPISAAIVNTFEPIQAHLRWQNGGESERVELLAGRFTLDIGSRRQIGRNNFRNANNAFTGLSVDWRSGDQRLRAFATLPQRRRPSDPDALLENEHELDKEGLDQRLHGLWYQIGGIGENLTLELMVHRLDERDGDGFETANRDLWTPSLRLFRRPAPESWHFDLEAALQRGERRASRAATDRRDLDVRAAFVHLDIGRSITVPWPGTIAFEYEFASGDGDPADGTWGRFELPFGPRRSDFGPTGIFGPLGRENLHSPGIRYSFRPAQGLSAFVVVRALWADTVRDRFGRTGVIDPAGETNRFAGWFSEGRLRIDLVPRSLRLELGAAALVPRGQLAKAPNAATDEATLYAYSELEFRF